MKTPCYQLKRKVVSLVTFRKFVIYLVNGRTREHELSRTFSEVIVVVV